jgi:hypothetical protein
MFKKVRSRFTYANLMATVAVFVALGGSSYAALSVTGKDVRNSSLTGKDIKNSSLSTKDVKNRSLLAEDFGAGQLPPGPQGAKGDTGGQGQQGIEGRPGPPGETGPSDAYFKRNTEPTPLGANAQTEVLQMSVPQAGDYTYTATVSVNTNASEGHFVVCSVTGPGGSQGSPGESALGAGAGYSRYDTLTIQGVANDAPAAGVFRLRCATNATDGITLAQGKSLLATRVGSVALR